MVESSDLLGPDGSAWLNPGQPIIEIPRMTQIIEFKRQLWPPPPPGAHPWFCYIQTLKFYDQDWKEVWSQEIPECDQFMRDKLRLRIYYVHVEFDQHFGWCLVFKTSHDTAKKVWDYLFHDFRGYDSESMQESESNE